jgi:low affinity Fe/Cu permease
VVVSWVVIALIGFDQHLQVGFATVCAGITVTMVFVLQHTQRREQAALQLKLDELVRALPQADDHLIGVESSPDEELRARQQRHLQHHVGLRERDD